MTFTNGDVYKGEFVEGKQHGRGTTAYADKDKYVGEWENGTYHGQGTLSSPMVLNTLVDGKTAIQTARE